MLLSRGASMVLRTATMPLCVARMRRLAGMMRLQPASAPLDAPMSGLDAPTPARKAPTMPRVATSLRSDIPSTVVNGGTSRLKGAMQRQQPASLPCPSPRARKPTPNKKPHLCGFLSCPLNRGGTHVVGKVSTCRLPRCPTKPLDLTNRQPSARSTQPWSGSSRYQCRQPWR